MQVDLYMTCKKDQFKDDTTVSHGPCLSYKEDLEESGQATISTNHCRPRSRLYNYTPTWGQFRTDFTNKFFPKNETQEVPQ